jgi:hypothetical protein
MVLVPSVAYTMAAHSLMELVEYLQLCHPYPQKCSCFIENGFSDLNGFPDSLYLCLCLAPSHFGYYIFSTYKAILEFGIRKIVLKDKIHAI